MAKMGIFEGKNEPKQTNFNPKSDDNGRKNGESAQAAWRKWENKRITV